MVREGYGWQKSRDGSRLVFRTNVAHAHGIVDNEYVTGGFARFRFDVPSAWSPAGIDEVSARVMQWMDEQGYFGEGAEVRTVFRSFDDRISYMPVGGSLAGFVFDEGDEYLCEMLMRFGDLWLRGPGGEYRWIFASAGVSVLCGDRDVVDRVGEDIPVRRQGGDRVRCWTTTTISRFTAH